MIKAVIARVKKFQYEKYAVFIALAVLFVISALLSPYFTLPSANQLDYKNLKIYSAVIFVTFFFKK